MGLTILVYRINQLIKSSLTYLLSLFKDQLHLPCILQISNHITFSKLKYLDLSNFYDSLGYNGIVSI